MTGPSVKRRRSTVEDRLEQMKADLRKIVTVMNQDNSFTPARNAQDALELVDTLLDNLPCEHIAWPPKLDKDGAFDCLTFEEMP